MSTTIPVINKLTDHTLQLETSVSPSLSHDDWAVKSKSAPATGKSHEVLWFNRNIGIKEDHTWIFTTKLQLGGTKVLLEEKVTGESFGSKMWQRIRIGDNNPDWLDTNDSASVKFRAEDKAVYKVSWALSLGSSGFMNITYTVDLVMPDWQKIEPVMTQVNTVVMLMLENRSLDTVLGWLYHDADPDVVFPPGSSPKFDGIPGDSSNSHGTTAYRPRHGTDKYHEPCRVPNFDPNEPMDHVRIQLYGDANGHVPHGYVWSSTPPMTGFAWDYYEIYIREPEQVMGGYTREQLPVLYGLAKNFAVSDRWFSSVPTQTDPNRAFSICGTSLGLEDNGGFNDEVFTGTNTVFDLLGAAGKTWGMYWQSVRPLGTGEKVWSWKPFTSNYFPRILKAPNGGVHPFDDFMHALKHGELPNFCYLEPYWGGGKGDAVDLTNTLWFGIQGNDYHPCAWVGPAEADLNELYNALVNSPQWPHMLFIITFDEHGGSWDHVPPPHATPPDDRVGKSGFKFDRLGVRVPTILVSPYVHPRMVFRAPAGSHHDFDHTSFIATLLKWAGIDPALAGMGARVAAAPTFEGVLTHDRRTDKPTFTVPPDYASQGGGVGATLGANIPPPLLPPNGIDIHEFREALDNSKSREEFQARLNALLAKSG